MADTPKHLGSTTSTSATTIYDNGSTAGTYTVVHSIVICNTSTTTTYTCSVSKSSTTNAHGLYLLSNISISPNDSVVMQMGQVLDPSCRYLVGQVQNSSLVITVSGVTGP